jgi:prenyltransferase beta subunit
MEFTQFATQMIDFQKMSFSNWYGAVAILQDQTTSAMKMVLQQNSWLPEEGRKAVQSWLDTCQQERGRFKSYVDGALDDLKKFTVEDQKTVQSKAKKQES